MRLKAFETELVIEYPFVILLMVAAFVDNKHLFMLLLFSALHEMGHILVLYLCKGKADKITLSYYGIGMKHSFCFGYYQELLFLLAGIIINGIFVVLDVQRRINMALLCINALPIYPLDMGRCIQLACQHMLPYEISDRFFEAFSIAVLIIFVGCSVFLKNYNLMMISVYLILFYFVERGKL